MLHRGLRPLYRLAPIADGEQTATALHMTNDEFRSLIQKREQDLLDEMDKNQTEARDMTDQASTEVMERMVNLEGRETLLRHNDADFQELREVRDALARLDDGSFGKCLDCGREIPAARLAAIPWTAYCLEDQEKRDRGGSQSSGSLTM